MRKLETSFNTAVTEDKAFLYRWFIDRPSPLGLVLATVPLATIAAALLIAPMEVYSREMTWDLLFNLDGAWRLYNGQIPHVDYHTELGTLAFALTALSFHLTGPNVMAFLVGECVVACIILALCIAAVVGRLPLVPAAVFVILCTLITLMPIPYGDPAGQYSFTADYNRFGWAFSGILFLLLFVEPLDARKSGVTKDHPICLTVLLMLYYLKITYFIVGMIALAFTSVVRGHVRVNRSGWLTVFAVALLNAVAPYNFAYLDDVVTAAFAGGSHPVGELVVRFQNNPAEYAIALAGCLLLTAGLVRRREPSDGVVGTAGAWFLMIAGILLLSQNFQAYGIPSYAIICLLVYVPARQIIQQEWSLDGRRCCLLLAPLALPMLLIVACLVSLLHYCYLARNTDKEYVVADSNLKGLAVPLDDLTPLEEFAHQDWTPYLFNRIRSGRHHFELSQLEYVRTIEDLSSSLRNAIGPANPSPTILVVDRVNPLPFVLGLPAPRGVDLWWGDGWGSGLIKRSGDEVFGDADLVAIPRYPTKLQTSKDVMDHYGSYLVSHYSIWYEISEWTIWRRLANADKH